MIQESTNPDKMPTFERPLETMVISIDESYFQSMTTFLEAHGATIERLSAVRYTPRLRNGTSEERTYYLCRVSFPKGARRFNELAWSYTVPFTVSFPDGAVLYGRDLSSLKEDGERWTVFEIPRS